MKRFRYVLMVCIVLGLASFVYGMLNIQTYKVKVMNTIPEYSIELVAPFPYHLQDREAVKEFMLLDTTDQHPYTEDYKCLNFAKDLVGNASTQGIVAQRISVFPTPNIVKYVMYITL